MTKYLETCLANTRRHYVKAAAAHRAAVQRHTALWNAPISELIRARKDMDAARDEMEQAQSLYNGVLAEARSYGVA